MSSMNYVVAANMTHGPMDQIEATAIDHRAAKCMGRAEPYARGFSQSGTRQEQLHESTNHLMTSTTGEVMLVDRHALWLGA